MKSREELNRISGQVIDAAIAVHREVGPGLLESAYQACLAYELRDRQFQVKTEAPVPVDYRDVHLDVGYRLDQLIENAVIVEVKSVTKLAPIHDAQLMTYLRLTNRSLGLLINFNTPLLKDGVKRIINNF